MDLAELKAIAQGACHLSQQGSSTEKIHTPALRVFLQQKAT